MTGEQLTELRRAHLSLANTARARRAEVKRELFGLGRVASAHRLALLLEDQEETVMRMRVQVMLLAVRGIGPAKARSILHATNITIGSIRVQELTPRQRNMLAGQLRIVQ
jgi:hypothetical protein